MMIVIMTIMRKNAHLCIKKQEEDTIILEVMISIASATLLSVYLCLCIGLDVVLG